MFYNKLLIGKDNSFNSAFNTFKSNADADSSVINDNAILDANFQHLPVDFLDADLTMVAGAYGTGKICAYDSVGNIVDLGFSKRVNGTWGDADLSNTKFLDRNGNQYIYTPNTPILDKWFMGSSWGYILNDYQITPSSLGDAYPLSFYRNTPYNLNSYYISPAFTDSPDPNTAYVKFGETNTVGMRYLFNSINNGVENKVYFNMLVKKFSTNRYMMLHNHNVAFESANHCILKLDGNLNVVYQRSDVIFKIQHFKDDWYLITTENSRTTGHVTTYMTLSFTDSPTSLISNSYTGDPSIEYYFGQVSAGGKYSMIQNGVYSRETTLSNIILTSNSIIFIKTAKTSKLLTLPSGTFNIQDYITNDKLICFTIKYI